MDDDHQRLGSAKGVKEDTLRRAVVGAAFLLALDMADFFPEVAFFVSDDFFAFCSLAAGSAYCGIIRGQREWKYTPQTLPVETDCFVALAAALAAALCFTGVFLVGVVVFLAVVFFCTDLRSSFAASAYAHVKDESHRSI